MSLELSWYGNEKLARIIHSETFPLKMKENIHLTTEFYFYTTFSFLRYRNLELIPQWKRKRMKKRDKSQRSNMMVRVVIIMGVRHMTMLWPWVQR